MLLNASNFSIREPLLHTQSYSVTLLLLKFIAGDVRSLHPLNFFYPSYTDKTIYCLLLTTEKRTVHFANV